MLLDAFMPAINKVLELIPDVNARAKAAADLQSQILTILSSEDTAQANITNTEAQSESFWKSGARPALLWIGTISMAWFYFLHPILAWGVGCIDPAIIIPDSGKPDDMLNMVYALLGISASRSFDKWKANS
jgi:hypothetical protein